MRLLYLNIWIIFFVLFSIINIFFVVRHSSSVPFIRQRIPQKLIQSGININSFNPPIIHLTFHAYYIQSNFLSIVDNNVTLVQLWKPLNILTIKLILSDGYHQLDITVVDRIQRREFYQSIDISIGRHFLLVTIRDEEQVIKNITVHLHIVDHSHIYLEETTNHLGQVTFPYLPPETLVHIEAVCIQSKRYAFVEMKPVYHEEIILVLKNISASTDDEYDSQDRGFYAI